MDSGVILSVLIVGQRNGLTARAREAWTALRGCTEVEVLLVELVESSDGSPLPEGVCLVGGGLGSYFDSIQRGVYKARGEWVIVLDPEEHLHVGAVSSLISQLKTSTLSLRHARVLLHNPEETAREELGGTPSCNFAAMLRWWKIGETPHPGALFIRRALLKQVLERVNFPEHFGRYAIGVIASKGGTSLALPLCSSVGVFTPERARVAERDRIHGTQLEISELSPLEQSEVWREYYEWCAHSNAIHFTPIMLPQSRAQAQGLATMLGNSKRSMFEALWFVYRDVETSKQAALLLTRWGLVTDNNASSAGVSDRFRALGSYLSTELYRRDLETIVLINEHLEAGPAPMIARVLRDMNKFGVSLCAVSHTQRDDRRVVGGLAQKGLLGWIRSIRPLTDTVDLPGFQRALGRAVNEYDGKIDCVIIDSEDPFFDRGVSCLSQRIQRSFSLVVYGAQASQALSRVESSLAPHRVCSLSMSEPDLSVVECVVAGEVAACPSPE